MYQEFPIPGFSNYKATACGNIISHKGKSPRVMKQKPQKNARCRKQVRLTDDNGERRSPVSHRVILSAKLGRELEPWEQVRHRNGDRNDNRMGNLVPGCAILNMIDDIENGTRETNADYLDQAIARLISIRASLG